MSDRLLVGVWGELVAELNAPRPLALVALGGYGRRELAPCSDLDLLLLRSPRVRQAEVEPLARTFSTFLWDLHRAPGWSVRTPAESVKAAEEDHTVRTALLDCRFLAGDPRVFHSLSDHLLRELLTHRAAQFIADKAREVRLRREKYGDSVFVLEPDIKQSEGGLRDLQAALWIAQARFRVRGLGELLKQSILPGSEVQLLRAARDFLLRIRNELHYARGRKEDRLTFELQEHAAAFLGYVSGPQGLGVEQFMRHYYLSAKAIRRAADSLIARCEEEPSDRARTRMTRRLGAFKVFAGKLTLEGSPDLFSQQPATVLQLFRVADEESLPIYGWAQQQVVRALPDLEKARGDLAVVDELKKLLARPGTRGQFLFEMHELGALGAVLPEFGRVTAHHQHDLYHVYTVDVHSLFALRRLYALRAGDLVEKEPELSRLMRDLEDPLPLYLGMLFHDAGKGLGGNHSIRGRELMSQVADRLNLSPRQRELAEFLVLEHLSMSRTAQRRDLSDPKLISDFAAMVGNPEKLTCLYLLTYADISSVGPEMWNEWKASLLSQLYEKTRTVLLKGSDQGSADACGIERTFMTHWTRAFGEARARALRDSMPARYFSWADPNSANLHARMLARARRMQLVTAIRHRREAGFTELTLCTRDQPGLLAVLTGVLSAHGLDILRARITSTPDGWVLDVFDVWAPQGRLVEHSRWRAARADLVAVLAGDQSVQEVLSRRRANPLFLRRLPPVETRVSLDNRVSQNFSVVDVRAQDRVGLLHCIASFLAAQHLEIAFASIATEAHCALDSFYVTFNGRKVTEPAQVETVSAGLRAAIEALELHGRTDAGLASKQPPS